MLVGDRLKFHESCRSETLKLPFQEAAQFRVFLIKFTQQTSLFIAGA
jgi:hypothetical protein